MITFGTQNGTGQTSNENTVRKMSNFRTEGSYEFRPVFWLILELSPSFYWLSNHRSHMYLLLHLSRIVPTFGSSCKIPSLNFGIQNKTWKPQNFQ